MRLPNLQKKTTKNQQTTIPISSQSAASVSMQPVLSCYSMSDIQYDLCDSTVSTRSADIGLPTARRVVMQQRGLWTHCQGKIMAFCDLGVSVNKENEDFFWGRCVATSHHPVCIPNGFRLLPLLLHPPPSSSPLFSPPDPDTFLSTSIPVYK